MDKSTVTRCYLRDPIALRHQPFTSRRPVRVLAATSGWWGRFVDHPLEELPS
jgi:hypothetical protein